MLLVARRRRPLGCRASQLSHRGLQPGDCLVTADLFDQDGYGLPEDPLHFSLVGHAGSVLGWVPAFSDLCSSSGGLRQSPCEAGDAPARPARYRKGGGRQHRRGDRPGADLPCPTAAPAGCGGRDLAPEAGAEAGHVRGPAAPATGGDTPARRDDRAVRRARSAASRGGLELREPSVSGPRRKRERNRPVYSALVCSMSAVGRPVPAPEAVPVAVRGGVKVDELLARMPQAIEKYRRMVQRLGDAPINVERGRELLRGLLGDIRIAPRGDHLVARMGLGIAQPILASNRGSGGRI
jgi:hypothetical protein